MQVQISADEFVEPQVDTAETDTTDELIEAETGAIETVHTCPDQVPEENLESVDIEATPKPLSIQ